VAAIEKEGYLQVCCGFRKGQDSRDGGFEDFSVVPIQDVKVLECVGTERGEGGAGFPVNLAAGEGERYCAAKRSRGDAAMD
jgi:hypothetical protein